MNPHAKTYAPPPPQQTWPPQPSPVIGTLPGWPSFPSHALPSRGHPRTTPARRPPENMNQHMVQPKAAVIDFTWAHLGELSALVHPQSELKANGYVLDHLTSQEIEAKTRCDACGKFARRPGKFANRPHHGKAPATKLPPGSNPKVPFGEQIPSSAGALASMNTSQRLITPHQNAPETPKVPIVPNGHPDAEPPPPKNICHFHPGVVDRAKRVWTCCGKRLSEQPCAGAPEHTPVIYAPGQLEEQWQYFRTPPGITTGADTRYAVAIDCEMGTALDGDSELIRVTVLDYFSGEILVDRLVYPDVVMQHFNTRYSGVTRLMMETAKKNKTCFFGRTQAREALWKFVGPGTIVIGHSAGNDLKSLRWIHNRVVDSFMLEPKPVDEGIKEKDKEKEKAEEEASNGTGKDTSGVEQPSGTDNGQHKGEKQAQQGSDKPKTPKAPKGSGPRSLKTLARVKLGREIQNRGKLGHDSLEDAIAARDLVHWQVLERQKQLKVPKRAQ